MRDITLSEIAQLEAGTADNTFQMDEDTFRAFYDRTARGVWAYLCRMSGDSRAADDLLQETYYRFLKIGGTYESDAHQRNYLFRIATNLVHDLRRKRRVEPVDTIEEADATAAESGGDVAVAAARRIDLSRAMAQLKPRERELLWLAYAQGSSHVEIAQSLGLKASSIKGLLFRARKRLAGVLTSRSSQ
jgi:RNA polymerase sigma-70 factor (ECF subfamily)